MDVGEIANYTLPEVYDPDSNSLIEVYLDQYPDEGWSKYPPFLTFENETNILIFTPDTIWVRGRNYYFSMVVKEANSDTIMTRYLASVVINGEPTTDIQYRIQNLKQPDPLKPLQGTIIFDQTVNTTYIDWNRKFYKMFDIYYYDESWIPTEQLTYVKIPIPDEDVYITGITSQSLNIEILFTINERTEGTIFFDINEDFNLPRIFVGNASETRLLNNSTHSVFDSYQVDAQEYLRQHWYDSSSKHGHDYGIQFDSIVADPEVGSFYTLSGFYKSFYENRVPEIIYIMMVVSGYNITEDNYILNYA